MSSATRNHQTRSSEVYSNTSLPIARERIKTKGSARRTDKRRVILLAAAVELRERGPRALSMAAVARRAGVSKVTVYRYFEDADDLYRTLTAGEEL